MLFFVANTNAANSDFLGGRQVVAAKMGVQYTNSSLKLWQEMHTAYKAGLSDGVTTFNEFTGIKAIRPDFVGFGTKTIYELKPFNLRQIRLRTKQLNNYKSLLSRIMEVLGKQF